MCVYLFICLLAFLLALFVTTFSVGFHVPLFCFVSLSIRDLRIWYKDVLCAMSFLLYESLYGIPDDILFSFCTFLSLYYLCIATASHRFQQIFGVQWLAGFRSSLHFTSLVVCSLSLKLLTSFGLYCNCDTFVEFFL